MIDLVPCGEFMMKKLEVIRDNSHYLKAMWYY